MWLSEDDTHTTNEKSVACENNTLVSVLHIVADAVLRMTGSMQCLHWDTISDFEFLAMRGSLSDRRAVLATNDLKTLELFQLEQMLVRVNTQ